MKIIKYIGAIMEAALIGSLVFMVFKVITSAYLDSLKHSSGIMLASQEVGLEHSPVIVGVMGFIVWLWVKLKSIED